MFSRIRRVLVMTCVGLFALASVATAHLSPSGSYHTSHTHYEYWYYYTAEGFTGCYSHTWYKQIEYTHHYDPSGVLQGHDNAVQVGTYDDVRWISWSCP